MAETPQHNDSFESREAQVASFFQKQGHGLPPNSDGEPRKKKSRYCWTDSRLISNIPPTNTINSTLVSNTVTIPHSGAQYPLPPLDPVSLQPSALDPTLVLCESSPLRGSLHYFFAGDIALNDTSPSMFTRNITDISQDNNPADLAPTSLDAQNQTCYLTSMNATDMPLFVPFYRDSSHLSVTTEETGSFPFVSGADATSYGLNGAPPMAHFDGEESIFAGYMPHHLASSQSSQYPDFSYMGHISPEDFHDASCASMGQYLASNIPQPTPQQPGLPYAAVFPQMNVGHDLAHQQIPHQDAMNSNGTAHVYAGFPGTTEQLSWSSSSMRDQTALFPRPMPVLSTQQQIQQQTNMLQPGHNGNDNFSFTYPSNSSQPTLPPAPPIVPPQLLLKRQQPCSVPRAMDPFNHPFERRYCGDSGHNSGLSSAQASRGSSVEDATATSEKNASSNWGTSTRPLLAPRQHGSSNTTHVQTQAPPIKSNKNKRKTYNPEEKEDVASKRNTGICFRCRTRRGKCHITFGQDGKPTNECPSCSKANQLDRAFPCTVMQLANDKIYRVSNTQPFEEFFPFTGDHYGGFDLVKPLCSDDFNMQFEMRHKFFTNPLVVTVCKVVMPVNEYPREKMLDGKNGFLLEIPYAFAGEESAALELMTYINNNYIDYVLAYIQRCDEPRVSEPLQFALEKAQDGCSDIHAALQFWVACRCIEGGWTCGSETLGAENLHRPSWRQGPGRRHIRLPPFIEYQLQAVLMEKILKRLKAAVVKGLNKWLYKPNNMRHIVAIETFLVTFVVVHSLEVMFEHDQAYAKRRQNPLIYVDYKVIRELFGAAYNILLLYHYQHRETPVFHPPDINDIESHINKFKFTTPAERDFARRYIEIICSNRDLDPTDKTAIFRHSVLGQFTKCLTMKTWLSIELPPNCPKLASEGPYPVRPQPYPFMLV